MTNYEHIPCIRLYFGPKWNLIHYYNTQLKPVCAHSVICHVLLYIVTWKVNIYRDCSDITIAQQYRNKSFHVWTYLRETSILGPSLLFLLYITDLPNTLKYLRAILFADDSTVYGSSKSLSTLVRNTQDDTNKLNDWLCANKLSLNIHKTNFIVFSLKPVTDPININGTRINREFSTKFLGVYIDQTLNWGEHCKNARWNCLLH